MSAASHFVDRNSHLISDAAGEETCLRFAQVANFHIKELTFFSHMCGGIKALEIKARSVDCK